jgi:hypothetical protein
MSRGSRALCTLYTATALWHAWCTINTLGYAPLWASVLNMAASVVAVIAIVREYDLADERHEVAALREREGRRNAWPGPPPDDGPPLNDREQDAFDQLAAQFDDPRSNAA